jgi:hypothetical protein
MAIRNPNRIPKAERREMTDFFETSNDPPVNVLDFIAAKKKRDIEEERRLERLVIERWIGKQDEMDREE